MVFIALGRLLGQQKRPTLTLIQCRLTWQSSVTGVALLQMPTIWWHLTLATKVSCCIMRHSPLPEVHFD